jgi:hypothetical protein
MWSCALAAILAGQGAYALEDRAAAQWNADFTSLQTDFGGIKATYPEAMTDGAYPAAGGPIAVTISSVWPVVFVHARFVTDMATWPPEYRTSALDLVTMYIGDASRYQDTLRKYVLEAAFDRPPEFLEEARDPHNFSLVESLRGKPIKYRSTSSAGFGAADYTVVNVATLGLSQDGRTVISFGDPESISDHLRDRKLVIGIHDDGDYLYFDIRAICLCKERWLFQDEMMNRIGQTMNYIGEQLSEKLRVPPSRETIEKYLEYVRTTDVTSN